MRSHGRGCRVIPHTAMMIMIALIKPRRQLFDPAKTFPQPLDAAGAGLSTKSVDP